MVASVGGPIIGGLVILAVVTFAGVGGGADRHGANAIRLDSPSVVILKSKHVLHLFDGDTLIRSYPIDLGTFPEGQKRRAGDGKTPEGIFHATALNPGSQYHRFIGIDYPDSSAVTRGLATGLISPGQAADIRHALRNERCPDWATALGGGIGIHGSRQGYDWTAGCIAMADRHVEELFAVLRPGDPIEILP